MLTSNIKLTFIILAFSTLACKEDEIATTPVSTPSVIQFNQSQMTVNENESEVTVTLSLNKAATLAGRVSIAMSSDQLLKFETEPVMTDGKLELPVGMGATAISFLVKPLNDELMDGNKTLTLTLAQVTSGFQVGTQNLLRLSVWDDERPVDASFLFNSGTVRENSVDGSTVMVALSGRVPASGTLVIGLASGNMIYGTHFTTEPALINGKLVLSVALGVDHVSFKIKPTNDSQFNGDRTIQFVMEAAEGGVQKGPGLIHDLKITDDELAARGKSYEIVGGNWKAKRAYEYAENGLLSKITWEQYTPSYKGGVYSYEYIQNKVHKMVENANRETYYLWEGNRIVKSEQYTNGLLTQYTLYGYDQAGNIGETAIHYSQPDGSLKLGLVLVYMYNTNGNLYKKMAYVPVEGSEEYSLTATYTYDDYLDADNPFPIEILPNVNSQPKLPASYRVEEGGKDILYNFTYEFDADGRPVKRVAASTFGYETATYTYF